MQAADTLNRLISCEVPVWYTRRHDAPVCCSSLDNQLAVYGVQLGCGLRVAVCRLQCAACRCAGL